MLLIALFVLGLVGSLWTTVFAILAYRVERLAEFDRLLQQVVYDEVFLQYCVPLLLQKLRQWPPPGVSNTKQAYIALRTMAMLTPMEYCTFTSLCCQSIACRRLWLPRTFIARRVDEVAIQYVWHDFLSSKLVRSRWSRPFEAACLRS